MTMISDLPWDLVEEILLRTPITSLGAVRSTCRRWNALSKDRILCKAETKHQFLGFMIKNSKLCSLRFDLHGHDPSVKEITTPFNIQVEISEVLLCDDLLLCVPKYQPCLMVWNPYLGQTRWIQTRTAYASSDMYALGYDNSKKNRNHKLLSYSGKSESEIYDFKTDSWRVLDGTLDRNVLYKRSASLKGNAYFMDVDEYAGTLVGSFHCFDFTTERFGQVLHLPPSPSHFGRATSLVSLREEKLAALSTGIEGFRVAIWVTTKIEPNAVSWINFLRIDLEAIPCDFFFGGNGFFIDEEKKLAVLFGSGYSYTSTEPKTWCNTSFIIGENKFLKAVYHGEVNSYSWPVVCSSSYVPSLVQIKPNSTRQKEREEEEASQQALVVPSQKTNTKWSLEDCLVFAPSTIICYLFLASPLFQFFLLF